METRKKELVRFLTDCGLREHKDVIKEGRTKHDQVIYAQYMMSVQTGNWTIMARHRIQVSYAIMAVIRQTLVEGIRYSGHRLIQLWKILGVEVLIDQASSP